MDQDDSELNLNDFVESRSREMRIMLELSSKVSGNNAPQQQVPRHMRRRAASHDVRRLPLALRQKFMNEQLKSGLPGSNKRPSRKHRRRPKNLFSEYAKRSRRIRWMETHIWHARRFHMGSLWRCRVPLHRNDRGVRAAYRDSKSECLIGDLSWMHCMEVVGTENDIMKHLCAYTNSCTGALLNDVDYIGGQKEGRVMLYSTNGYPHKPICMVSFMWTATFTMRATEDHSRHLFFWVHPSSFQLLLDTFITDLSLQSSDGEAKRFYSGGNIQMIDRTGDFNRFHLLGPKTQSVLFATLKMNVPNQTPIKQLYGLDDDERTAVEDQISYWQDLGLMTHHLTSPHSIISLQVSDPRLSMPKKRLDAEDQFSHDPPTTMPPLKPTPLAFSPLWDSGRMALLKEKTLSTHQLNELKAGSSYYDYDPSVPVLLLHNPSSQTSGSRGGGWDVVVPAGWGMFFWVAFVYRGARSVGLKELEHINFETQQLSFPALFPDTPAGKDCHLKEFQTLKAKYERMPPAKRCNYIKHNVSSPFHFPFQELCEMWLKIYKEKNDILPQIGPYFVIRDIKFLRELKNKVEKTVNRKQGMSEKPAMKFKCVIRVKNSSRVYATVLDGDREKVVSVNDFLPNLSYLNSKIDSYLSGLVSVHLVVVGKGSPGQFAMIYLPSQQDLQRIANQKPLEAEQLKKGPRSKALKRGKKKCAKKKKEEDDGEKDELLPPVLNEDEMGISSEPQRLLIGYVLQGGFSFGLSKGAALGLITLPGLLRLIATCQQFRSNNHQHAHAYNSTNVVLIRDSTSLHCRYANYSILTDVI